MNQKLKDDFWLYLKAHPAPRHALDSHPVCLGNISFDQETQKIINLSEPETYERILNLFKERIEKAEDVQRLFSIIRIPYLLPFLDFVQKHMTDEEFSESLGASWHLVEYPHQHGIRNCLRMWKRAIPEKAMMDADLEEFERLPKRMTVYRGLQGEKSKVRGLSWTLNIQKAIWFANRWNHHGKVYAAEIDKKNCFAFYGKEEEVVVNPYHLENIRIEIEKSEGLNRSNHSLSSVGKSDNQMERGEKNGEL